MYINSGDAIAQIASPCRYLEQSSTFRPFMRKLIALLEIAGGTSQHNKIHIMARDCFCATQGNGVLKVVDVFTLCSLKFERAIVAPEMLLSQFLLYLLGSKCTRNSQFTRSALVGMSTKNHSAMLSLAVFSSKFCVQLFVSCTVMSYVVLISLSSLPVKFTFYFFARCSIAVFSIVIYFFISLVVCSFLCPYGIPVFGCIYSSSLFFQFFVVYMVLPAIYFSFFPVFHNISSIIFAFVLSMIFGPLQTIQSLLLSTWDAKHFSARFAVGTQSIIVGLIFSKNFRGCRKNLLTRTCTSLAGYIILRVKFECNLDGLFWYNVTHDRVPHFIGKGFCGARNITKAQHHLPLQYTTNPLHRQLHAHLQEVC